MTRVIRRARRSVWLASLVALVVWSATSAPAQSARPAAKAASANQGRDLAAATPESVGISSERLQRLDAGMKAIVDKQQMAGIVTLLARHGKIVNFNAIGRKDVRKPDPMDKDTIFRIYSMTKPVTGVAMMMLYEEGKWRLDEPVSRHIPEFARMKVYTGQGADGTPQVEDARRPMTMRELMTHTAGLGYTLSPDNPVDRMFIQSRVLNPAAPLQTMIEGIAKLPLKSQPGTRWAYSSAVDVQGYLVEKLSGQPFGEFLRTRLFEPLGMKDTGFYLPAEKVSRLALVHDGSGELTISDRGDPTRQPLGPSGGGGLFSTAMDYARFCQMLLNGGEFNGTRILAPRTVEMMRTNHVNPEPLKTMPAGTGWGMDFQVITDAAAAGDAAPAGTFSWWGIAGTWFWIDPANDVAFIGLLQHANTQATRPIHALSRQLVYQAIVN
jgi:CubicO group peptidase (beta-lactamase class C family)